LGAAGAIGGVGAPGNFPSAAAIRDFHP